MIKMLVSILKKGVGILVYTLQSTIHDFYTDYIGYIHFTNTVMHAAKIVYI